MMPRSRSRNARSPTPSQSGGIPRSGPPGRRSVDVSGASHYSRADLCRCTLGVLQQTAMDAGVDANSVYAAIDSSDAKDTLVALILAAQDPTSVESQEQAAKLHAMRHADQQMEEIHRDELSLRFEQAREFAGALRKGDSVYYFDLQASTWLPAAVELVHADSYHVDLRSKHWRVRSVDAQRIRRPTALEEEERREQHVSMRIGERVQYFNQPSADWIEAVITDIAQNAAGRLNAVDLKVCYSKHWPVADVTVPRVSLRQIRALTEQRAGDEAQRRQVRWSAALREEGSDDDGAQRGGGLYAHSNEDHERHAYAYPDRSSSTWGGPGGSNRDEQPPELPSPSDSESEDPF